MSTQSRTAPVAWPRFPVEAWQLTYPTLQLWTQIVGKVRLSLSPRQNHFWHVPLYVSTHGLTTSAMPYGAELCEIEFDFVNQELVFNTSWGPRRVLPLRARSVADFYADVMATLRELGMEVTIWPMPVEIAEPIRFDQDQIHASYDPAAAEAFWRVLVRADHVFKRFRGQFLGKSSPSHFFWGSFDLAVTRFSGQRAPMFTGPTVNVNPHVMHESYSHAVSSAGLWPGDESTPPLFYSYAVPEPPGFAEAAVAPSGASYSAAMREFVLPYEAVREADEPDEALLAFLQTTYAAAADRGGWDRVLLEETPPCTCVNR